MWLVVLLLLAGPAHAGAGESPLPACPSAGQPPAAETVSMQNKPAMNRHHTNSTDGTACHLNCNFQKKQNNTVEKRYSPLTGTCMHPHHPQNVEGSVYISAFPMVVAGLLLQMVKVQLIHPDSRRKWNLSSAFDPPPEGAMSSSGAAIQNHWVI